MSIDSFLTSTLSVEIEPGKPPMLFTDGGGDALEWVAEHRDALRGVVLDHGSILVRGLELHDATQIGDVFRALADELMTEREPFDVRRGYSDRVFGATKWASNQQMCSHHELSYVCEAPGLMLFACVRGPTSGGATGVADAAAVLEGLPPELTMRFEREGWMLERNYNDEMGASIAESFGVADRASVEAYCRANAIEWDWQPHGGLRTRQRRHATIRHPATGERCWFNQIAFLNEWTLEPEIREYLIEIYGAAGLPFNTRYGSGDPIGEDVVRTINEVYEAHIRREPLRAGDLMLVDNVRTAHSREPYEGDREVVVAMGDPIRIADCTTTPTN